MNPILMELGDISVAFVDDLKFRAKAVDNQSVITQAAINELVQWSQSFFTPLSLEKCLVLHWGKLIHDLRTHVECINCHLLVNL